jgi:inositol phosphorylceramide mannosyltransferase catalytic subunit
MRALESAGMSLPAREPRIPRRVIQTGRDRNLPLLHRAAVTTVTLLNPDFEHCFFDDDDVDRFVEREFPQYRALFHAFPFPIQRYDFFRYLAVYRYGGFYLDLDVLLASSLSGLAHLGCVFAFDDLNVSRFLRRRHGMDWTIGNYAFGAHAGHPFLGAVIDNCVRAQTDRRWGAAALRGIPRPFRDDFVVLNTTGPWLVSRTYAENPALAASVTVLTPENVCDPWTWHKFGDVGVHLMEGSWRSRGGFVRRRLRWLWETWTFKRCMRESLARRAAAPAVRADEGRRRRA